MKFTELRKRSLQPSTVLARWRGHGLCNKLPEEDVDIANPACPKAAYNLVCYDI